MKQSNGKPVFFQLACFQKFLIIFDQHIFSCTIEEVHALQVSILLINMFRLSSLCRWVCYVCDMSDKVVVVCNVDCGLF